MIENLDVTIGVQHDIVKLEIAVNDTALVQEQQSQDDFCRVKTRARLVELPGLLDLEHEIAAVDVLHDKEEAVVRLEAGVQLRQIWVLAAQSEHALLS